MTLQYFGENLRRRRRAVDLTQTHLATRTDLDRTYISHLEHGRKPSREEHVSVLAAALGVSTDALLRRPHKILLPVSVAGAADSARQVRA